VNAVVFAFPSSPATGKGYDLSYEARLGGARTVFSLVIESPAAIEGKDYLLTLGGVFAVLKPGRFQIAMRNPAVSNRGENVTENEAKEHGYGGERQDGRPLDALPAK
jgi:hypothetical protein